MLWNILCLTQIMILPDDKSFAIDFTFDNARFNAICIAQVVKINEACRFSGTYQVKLHDLSSLDATFLYTYNELTTQWNGVLIDSNEHVQPGLMEIIAEEIAARYG